MALGTSLAVPAFANPLRATIAPSGMCAAASSAVMIGKVPAYITVFLLLNLGEHRMVDVRISAAI
jgi:hypothetical protein